MHVALGKPAGPGLGVRRTLKMLAERPLLAVRLGGVIGFRSYLSIHCQLVG